MSASEEYYDGYVKRQLEMGINYRHISIIELLKENGLKKGDSVLEIGCGVGTVTKLIAKVLKDGKILANDISSKSVDAAKNELSFYKDISFIAGDILRIDLNEKFDWIILPDVLEHIPIENHPTLFKYLEGLLIPEGKIFIHIPNPHYLSWVHENQPELLQLIDQPIWLEQLLKDIKGTSLKITKMVDYSIYIKPFDYRYMVMQIVKNPKFVSLSKKSHGLFDKIKFKMKYS